MIMTIHSFIYILYSFRGSLIFYFSLDYMLETQKTRPSWRNQFAAYLLILRAESPAWVLIVIRRVAGPFFTTKQTSVEISIVNFSFTFLSSQGCLNRSFLPPSGCFVGDLTLKLCFADGRGRAFMLEKQGHKFSFNLHGDIKNKLKLECITIGRSGEEEGLQTPKKLGQKFFL